MTKSRISFQMNRRTLLAAMAVAAGCALAPRGLAFADEPWKASKEDEAFLDDLERQGTLFFWEQGSPKTGQVLDRARNDLAGGRDPRRMASIAATGFGLTALCIADRRGYLPHAQIVERVKTTLEWHLNSMPEVHGFFYHFTDIESGERVKGVELSSIDTSLLLCGVLTAGAYFEDEKIHSSGIRFSRLALEYLLRVDDDLPARHWVSHPSCSGRALGQLQASGDSLQGIRLHQRQRPNFHSSVFAGLV
jgi:hypothetical protein